MTASAATLKAMQFSVLWDKQPINTTGSARETITYQYAGTKAPSDLPGYSYSGWTAFKTAEKTAFQKALRHIESFLNVKFTEVKGKSDPDLNVGKVKISGSEEGYGGIGITYNAKNEILSYDSFVVFSNTHDITKDANLIIHELGHALGLKHSFSTPTLPVSEENNKYTVMSYTANPVNNQRSDGMQIYDIYALQDLWGAAAYNAKATTYTKGRNSTVDAIWDTGGVDAFSANGRKTAVLFNLNQGAFSTFDRKHDVSITYGTVIENAFGGAGNDVLLGNGGNNRLIGNFGNDTLRAAKGSDFLSGGAGNDIVDGQVGTDILYGGYGNDRLFGGYHNDKLYGQSGKDYMDGGLGPDYMSGGLHDDILLGGGGDDTLHGNGGADRLNGAYGKDKLWGGDGNDILMGGFGDDLLYGGRHNDKVTGGLGNDRIFGGTENDILEGHGGNDTLAGEAGNDILKGGDGADTLNGGYGDDKLYGGNGNDSLNGGVGNDHLAGNKGTDTLTGGIGKDQFVFAKGDGKDTITDFKGNIDTLKITGYGKAATVLGKATEKGDDVIFTLSATDVLTVEDTTLSALSDDLVT